MSGPLSQTDRRGIDPALGALIGEAAGMRLADRPADGVRTTTPRALPVLSEPDPTYYDLPPIKPPVWVWAVPAYFFVGGVAGAASVLSGACQLLAPRRAEGLVRRARQLALAGDVAGSALLVYDLGRPSRFLHMLRVLRPTSPMSVGSWLLAGSGAANTAAVLLGGRPGLAGRLGGAAGLLAAGLGGPLAGYTGVLLAHTVVPLWSAGHRALPPLFVASAAGSAGWALALLAPPGPGRQIARRLAVGGTAAELVLGRAWERTVGRVPRVARPLRAGRAARLWRGSQVLAAGALLGAGLAVLAARRAASRSGRGGSRGSGAVVQGVASALGLLGSLALRWAVFQGGRDSAQDARATFHLQRARSGGAA